MTNAYPVECSSKNVVAEWSSIGTKKKAASADKKERIETKKRLC